MKCPYCNQEMQAGYLYYGKADIRWIPEKEKPGMLINHPQEYEVELMKFKYIKGCKLPTYRCASCHIELIIEEEIPK